MPKTSRPSTIFWSKANAQHHVVRRGCVAFSHAECVYTHRANNYPAHVKKIGASKELQTLSMSYFASYIFPHPVRAPGGKGQLTQQPCYMSHADSTSVYLHNKIPPEKAGPENLLIILSLPYILKKITKSLRYSIKGAVGASGSTSQK